MHTCIAGHDFLASVLRAMWSLSLAHPRMMSCHRKNKHEEPCHLWTHESHTFALWHMQLSVSFVLFASLSCTAGARCACALQDHAPFSPCTQ